MTGAREWCAQAWIRPNAGKDASKFGGTIFSKYNRGCAALGLAHKDPR